MRAANAARIFFVALPLTWQVEICVFLQIQETCFIVVYFLRVFYGYLPRKLSKARDTVRWPTSARLQSEELPLIK